MYVRPFNVGCFQLLCLPHVLLETWVAVLIIRLMHSSMTRDPARCFVLFWSANTFGVGFGSSPFSYISPMSIQDHHRGSTSISLSSDMSLDMPSLEPPMSSNENPPQLALSDIMHHMSPSPVPAEDSTTAEYPEMGGPYSNGIRREREGSPEPLTEADVVAIRRRLHELGISLGRDRNELNIGEDLNRHSDDFGDANLRERELVNMVCCPSVYYL